MTDRQCAALMAAMLSAVDHAVVELKAEMQQARGAEQTWNYMPEEACVDMAWSLLGSVETADSPQPVSSDPSHDTDPWHLGDPS